MSIWGHREKAMIYKPKKGAPGETKFTKTDLELLASRTAGKQISVVEVTQSIVIYCGSLNKLI